VKDDELMAVKDNQIETALRLTSATSTFLDEFDVGDVTVTQLAVKQRTGHQQPITVDVDNINNQSQSTSTLVHCSSRVREMSQL